MKDIQAVMEDLQAKANAEREAALPRPNLVIDEHRHFHLNKELLTLVNAHTILKTEEVTRGDKTHEKRTYGNNRVSVMVSDHELYLLVNSVEEMPALGETMRLTLNGVAKDTSKTNYAEVLIEHFGMNALIESDWTLKVGETAVSPTGSVIELKLATDIRRTPSVSVTSEEAEAIDMATADNEVEEEVVTELTIAEETELAAEELLEIQEVNVTTHTDIILE